MNYFAPGLRELARLLDRLVLRLRLVLARRKLAKLETALGLLGWQQADYDDATQKHVDRIMDVEREQSRLTNESAALSLEIQQIEKEREALGRVFEAAQARALQQGPPAAASLTELEAQLASKRAERKELEIRVNMLGRELGAAEEEYRLLVVQSASLPQAKDAMMRLRDTILARSRERSGWEEKMERAREEHDAMTAHVAALREAREQFEKKDAALAGEVATRQRKKQEVEKQIDALERAKTNPYREIGRVLADQDIPPLNQPESLNAVRAQRLIVAVGESAITASLEASRREDRAIVWQSWLLAGALLLLGTIVVFVAAQMLF